MAMIRTKGRSSLAAAFILITSTDVLFADQRQKERGEERKLPGASAPFSDIPAPPDPEPEPRVMPHPDPDSALQPRTPDQPPGSSPLVPHAAEPELPPPPMPEPAEPGLPPPPMPEPAEPPPLATNPEPLPPPVPPADPPKESDPI